MNLILIITVIGTFLIPYAAIELFKRRYSIHSEISRKALHVISGIMSIYWSRYLSFQEFIVCIFLFLIFFLANFHFRVLTSLYIKSRKTYGEFTYILGLFSLAMILYSRRDYFILGILILVFPDAVAGLVNHFYKKTHKTFFHVLSYFAVSLLITTYFLSIPISLLITIILTAVEFYSGFGLDNFTVPLFYSLSIYFFLKF
jgi:dolichol kinase